MRDTPRRLLQTFVTGLLAALPLAATLLIFIWGARLVYDWVGPASLVGGVMRSIGLGVTGSEVAGYAIGVAVVVAGVLALGALVQTRLRHAIAAALDGMVRRIPLVRNVYDLVKKFVDLLARSEDEGLRSMSPVWLHFGGAGRGDTAAVLGLLSTPEPLLLAGQPYLAVLVPTAPLPVGGGLLYVPQGWVEPANIGVEAVTSIYVSMGITSPQFLPRPPAG